MSDVLNRTNERSSQEVALSNVPEGFNAVVDALVETMHKAINDMINRGERQTTIHLPGSMAISIRTRTQATTPGDGRPREWLDIVLLVNEGGIMTMAVGDNLLMPPSPAGEHETTAVNEGNEEGEQDSEDSEDDEDYTATPWNLPGTFELDSTAREFLYNLLENHDGTQEEQEYMLRDIAAAVGMEPPEVEAIAFAPS